MTDKSGLKMDGPALTDFLAREFPQVRHLDMRIERVEINRLCIRLPVDDQHLRPGGTVSGPTLMTLADAGAYLLILSRIGPVALAVTTSLTINFLRKPEASRDILMEGRILKLGRRLAVCEAGLFSEGIADPVAHATVTYSIPPQAKEK